LLCGVRTFLAAPLHAERANATVWPGAGVAKEQRTCLARAAKQVHQRVRLADEKVQTC